MTKIVGAVANVANTIVGGPSVESLVGTVASGNNIVNDRAISIENVIGRLSDKSIVGMVVSGSMIINDWLITMEDVTGGHILTAKRGSEVQSMFIRDGIGEGSGGTSFITDNTLNFINGVLSVNTASTVEEDNTLPITSAAVAASVGNIEIILKTI